MDGWQGTPWSEGLDDKKLHGASLVPSTVWSREDPLYSAHQVSRRSHHSPSSIETCGIILILNEVVVLLLLLFLTFSALVANPKKTTLHGGQSRSWSAEQ